MEFIKGGERPLHGGGKRAAGTGCTDQLGQQGIELGGWCIAEITAPIDPYPGARWFFIAGDGAATLRHDAGLHRVASGCADRRLVGKAERGQRGAARDVELRFHKVDTGDLLRNRVFDLDAWITFYEVIGAALRRDQEFDGTGVDIVGCLGKRDRIIEHILPECWVEAGGGGDLDDFLMTNLYRAIAFVQMHGLA